MSRGRPAGAVSDRRGGGGHSLFNDLNIVITGS